MRTRTRQAASAGRGCFALANRSGQWWTGIAWAAAHQARRYSAGLDPDRDARQAAAEAESLTGISGHVYYIPESLCESFFAPPLMRAG